MWMRSCARSRVVAGVRTGIVFGALLGIVPQPLAAEEASDNVEALQQKVERQERLLGEMARRLKELEERLGGAAPTQSARAPLPQVARPPGPVRAPGEQTQNAGPQAPGQIDVDPDDAERALERTLVTTGGLLLPYGQAEVEFGFGYARVADQATFVDADNIVFSRDVRTNVMSGDARMRFGLPVDAQLELGLPYQYVREQEAFAVGFAGAGDNERSGQGLGDFRLGIAKTFVREEHWWPDVIARMTWDSNTGEFRENGVVLGGSGFHELDGSLTLVKRQDPLAFVGSFSYGTTFERKGIEPGDRMRFSLSALLAASPQTSLRFGFDNIIVEESKIDGASVGGSDQVIGVAVLGASSIVGRRTILDFSGGIGLTDEAPDYSVQLSLGWRFDLPTPLSDR